MANFVNVTIPNKYFFTSAAARDSYFEDNPTELKANLIVALQNSSYYIIQRYDFQAAAPVDPGDGQFSQDQLDAISGIVDAAVSQAVSDTITDDVTPLLAGKIDKTIVKDIVAAKTSNQTHDNLWSTAIEPIPVKNNETSALELRQHSINAETGDLVHKSVFLNLGTGLHFEYDTDDPDNPIITIVKD